MSILQIPSLSVEYVKVPVTSSADLTGLTVQMAIVADGQDPAGGDWKTGAWIGDSAAILIGPATLLPLTKGTTYGVWVKITSTPEIPVLGPYKLHIT